MCLCNDAHPGFALFARVSAYGRKSSRYRVAEVREPERYTEAAKDANWRAAMEEEMRSLVENETWDGTWLTHRRVK